MNFTEALAAMEADPDIIATLQVDGLYAGLRERGRLRALLKEGETDGWIIAWGEERSVFSSVFWLRVNGTGHQLREPVRQLLEMGAVPL